MVKYTYNPDLEVFRRVDNRGPSLKVNIVEARRIKTLMDLGIKAPTIMKKIDFANNISMTSLRTIMNNIQEGNLKLEGDYPAPTGILEDVDVQVRLNKLEAGYRELIAWKNSNECCCNCNNDNSYSIISKVKSWMQRK